VIRGPLLEVLRAEKLILRASQAIGGEMALRGDFI
jgi:hypothetical protein